MGGRKEEVNVVFLTEMGIIPSYSIPMKNLDLTFIISVYVMFFQNTTHRTRQKQKLTWFPKASEWSSDRGSWKIWSQTNFVSNRLHNESCVKLWKGGCLWHPDFSQKHLEKRKAHQQMCGWAVSSEVWCQARPFHPTAWHPAFFPHCSLPLCAHQPAAANYCLHKTGSVFWETNYRNLANICGQQQKVGQEFGLGSPLLNKLSQICFRWSCTEVGRSEEVNLLLKKKSLSKLCWKNWQIRWFLKKKK